MSIFEDPIPGYRFVVTLDPADAYLPPAQAVLLTLVALGQFSSAKGLTGELEVLAYPEGGVNDRVHLAHTQQGRCRGDELVHRRALRRWAGDHHRVDAGHPRRND